MPSFDHLPLPEEDFIARVEELTRDLSMPGFMRSFREGVCSDENFVEIIKARIAAEQAGETERAARLHELMTYIRSAVEGITVINARTGTPMSLEAAAAEIHENEGKKREREALKGLGLYLLIVSLLGAGLGVITYRKALFDLINTTREKK